MADRMHQVGFAQADAAVDEQRVIGARRRLRDGATRRMCELVGGTDDERVERITRAQTCRFALRVVFGFYLPHRRLGNGRWHRKVFRYKGDLSAWPLDFGERLVDDGGIV